MNMILSGYVWFCFYRYPEETEKEEQDAAEKTVTKEKFQGSWGYCCSSRGGRLVWGGVWVPSVSIQQFPAADLSAQPATEDWSTASPSQATEWVGVTEWPWPSLWEGTYPRHCPLFLKNLQWKQMLGTPWLLIHIHGDQLYAVRVLSHMST